MNTQEIIDNYIAEDLKLFKRYQGNDNYKRPKTDYLKKVIEMTDEKLSDECEHMIWLSAFANNNPRSDYHWQCDFCYDECKRRGKSEIYSIAHTRVSAQ